MPRITIPQKNLSIDAPTGSQLMQVLLDHQIPVASSCKGDGICSKCAMTVTPQGSPSKLEIETLQRNKKDLTLRLSCQIKVDEDLTVSTTYW